MTLSFLWNLCYTIVLVACIAHVFIVIGHIVFERVRNNITYLQLTRKEGWMMMHPDQRTKIKKEVMVLCFGILTFVTVFVIGEEFIR